MPRRGKGSLRGGRASRAPIAAFRGVSTRHRCLQVLGAPSTKGESAAPEEKEQWGQPIGARNFNSLCSGGTARCVVKLAKLHTAQIQGPRQK